MKPKLKSDVRLWRSLPSRRIFIGNRAIKLELPSNLSVANLEIALAEFKSNEIEWEQLKSRLTDEEFDVFEKILSGAGLIDSKSTAIIYQDNNCLQDKLQERRRLSVSEEIFLTRISIEANGITRTSDFKDGGLARVLERKYFQIEILGEGRLATSLFGLLVSSGFDNCRISPISRTSIFDSRAKNKFYVNSSSDLMGGYLQQKDIGFSRAESLYNLQQGSRLYADNYYCDDETDLVVCLGRPYPELLHSWLEKGTPQIYAEMISHGDIRIGPYVTGNSSACFNCVALSEVDSGIPLSMLLDYRHTFLPVALAGAGSGLMALEITRIADSDSSNLTDSTATLNMRNYLDPLITKWHRHPSCGCH